MAVEKILEKLRLTPDGPGVYQMRDASGHIIYVGKAKNLKNRLSSYFINKVHDAKVTAMLGNVADFDYFVCKSEKDALGLEANLIKKHKPHYNILLKDNKAFPYIKITDGDFPCLEVTRKLTKRPGDKFFGPYFNGIWAREFLSVIQDIFRVRTCTGALKTMAAKRTAARTGKEPDLNAVPSDFGHAACLNYQIGRCSGPCAGKITCADYANIIENVKSFLRGRGDFGAHEILEQKMQMAAEMQQFELAIRYRTGLQFLEKLKDRTITQVGRDVNCDVFASASSGEIFVVSVLTVRAGKLIGIQNFADANKGIESEADMLGGFIMQYFQENPIPEQIIAEYQLDDVAAALGCTVFRPKAALKKQLLEMAQNNAKEYIETSIEKIKFKNEFTVGACIELAQILALDIVPKKIECFDISHMAGEEQVASMVVFIDGRPERKLYRKFKIRHTEGNNDYLSMQEVLRRRLSRLEVVGGEKPDESFNFPPDLVIVDGGKGQLSAAMAVLGESRIAICALAEREEHIFLPGQSAPIILPKRSYALRLVERIRDEAHRFAITYHKKLRSKAATQQFKKGNGQLR